MRGIAVLSVDVEMDSPPCLSTWRGVEEGLPLLLEALRILGVKATFFTLGLVAVKYPKLVSRIVDEGHELGSHGWDHSRLDKLSLREAVDNVRKSLRVLRDYGDVESFRAPNFKLPNALLDLLREECVKIDSSTAAYKPPFPRSVWIERGVFRAPATHPSSVFRAPFPILRLLLSYPGSLVVLDLHPWELARVKCLRRPDLTAGVGERVAVNVARALAYLQSADYIVTTLREAAGILLERVEASRASRK